jgi:hypothetical protein
MKRRPSFSFTDEMRLRLSVEEFGRWAEDALRSLGDQIDENRKAAIAALAETDRAIYAVSKRLTELATRIAKVESRK